MFTILNKTIPNKPTDKTTPKLKNISFTKINLTNLENYSGVRCHGVLIPVWVIKPNAYIKRNYKRILKMEPISSTQNDSESSKTQTITKS